MFLIYKSVPRRAISLVLIKKSGKKYKNMGMMELFCKKSVLTKKPASTALSTDHRRARNTHDIKTFHRKLYRHNDISLLEHFLTFFKYNFFYNIFFIYMPYKYK